MSRHRVKDRETLRERERERERVRLATHHGRYPPLAEQTNN